MASVLLFTKSERNILASSMPVLCWGEVAEAGVQASLVVPVDPAGGGVLDLGDRLVGPVVEDGRADAFGLVEPVHRLGCVVRGRN